jgi:hypothetical protein
MASEIFLTRRTSTPAKFTSAHQPHRTDVPQLVDPKGNSYRMLYTHPEIPSLMNLLNYSRDPWPWERRN